MKPKTKKGFITITMINSSVIYVYLFFSSMFLFCDKFMFEEKKVPIVSTRNALHAVYNFFPMNRFCGKKLSDTSAHTTGGGGVGLTLSKLNLHLINAGKPNCLGKSM